MLSTPVAVFGELVLAVPEAGVAPPPLLPALGGHLLLLVVEADLGTVLYPASVKLKVRANLWSRTGVTAPERESGRELCEVFVSL